MDGLFYNEALDGVLNHPHPHPHAHPLHPEAGGGGGGGGGGGNGFETLTRNLSLNLTDAHAAHDALTLTSPDLHLLKLTSPELERLLIQSCNGASPTSPARAFQAPKHAAADDEQDAFPAPEFHQCHPRMSGDVPPVVAAGPPPHAFHAEQHAWDAYACAPPQFGCCAPALKDEPQQVPETPPLSPIDMEDQERIKAERKRMRNRVAASKCRKRKLERLARLEERVSRLTGENGELRGAADSLRDQVTQLRHQLLDHIKSGCKLLSQQLQTVKEF
ncbi:transcription factor Jun-like [Clarias gariepinus]|uniref:transcription factor Jun-like n=1 Tax=Clarias gariepinus TaxID=13013 RepID=UPI00234E054B|nr:transcription factor Jun-like [Clarias gariepinus]